MLLISTNSLDFGIGYSQRIIQRWINVITLMITLFLVDIIPCRGQQTCSLCHGTGDNPNYCRVCKGSGIGYKFIPEICMACAGGDQCCKICKGTGRHGTRRVKVPCSVCDGIPSIICPYCKGKGKTYGEHPDSTNNVCLTCNGKGTVQKACTACAGTGKAAFVSEYRMRHDIDYWVCIECHGQKKMRSKCLDCGGTGTKVEYIKRYRDRTLQFLNIRFMCEPCVHSKIYEHIGFVGSGTLNGNIRFEDGKFVNYSSRNSTQSNGWYNYHVTLRNTDVSYSDSLVQMECTYSSYGAMTPNGSPASNWKREKQEITNGADKNASYKIVEGKAFSEVVEIEYVNDSTIIETYNGNSYYRKYIITSHHIQIITPSEDDMWNVEIWLSEGRPIRIKDYSGERQYKYIDFDSHNNWTKRELVNSEGETLRTITRTITYNE